MEQDGGGLRHGTIWGDLCALAGDLVFVTDALGRIEQVLAAPGDRIGHSADTLAGCTLASLLPPNESLPEPGTRLAPVRVRGPDGVWQDCLLTLHARRDGGWVGALVAARNPDAADGNRAAVRRTLERMRARMRDEVLAPRIIGSALDELTRGLKADGAAVVVPTSAAELGQHMPRLTHVAGRSSEAASLPLVPCARQALAEDQVCTADSIGGRTLLGAPIPLRYGKPSALVAWRAAPGEWSADELALLAGCAEILGHPLETDNVQRDLTRHARTDLLTGLLTRRSFLEEVCRRLSRLDREGLSGTMVALNLDGFSVFSELHGPDTSDDALRYAAALLRDAIRPTDLAARIGADDFAVWLDGADGFTAAERAERLCRSGISVTHADTTHRFPVSIGLATRPPGSDEHIDDLLRRANAARLHAKRSGGGAWRTSREEMSP